MFPFPFPSKEATMSTNDTNYKPTCIRGSSSHMLVANPKPRLRWTAELHKRFVDSLAQLGGPDHATPKNIMRIMDVKGLTLYHVKSHLQKFRLGKHSHKDFNDRSVRPSGKAIEFQTDVATSSTGMASCSLSESIHQIEDLRMRTEVQRKLNEYLELQVQRRLQMRIDAQGKYMQTILEKAYQTICDQDNNMINIQDYQCRFSENDLDDNHRQGLMESMMTSNMNDFSSGELLRLCQPEFNDMHMDGSISSLQGEYLHVGQSSNN